MDQKIRDYAKNFTFLFGGMAIVCNTTTLLAIFANNDTDVDGTQIRVLFIRIFMLVFAFYETSKPESSITVTMLLWLAVTISIGSFIYFEVTSKGYMLAIDLFVFLMELTSFACSYLSHGAKPRENESEKENTSESKKALTSFEEAAPTNGTAPMMIQPPVVVQSSINTQPLLSDEAPK